MKGPFSHRIYNFHILIGFPSKHFASFFFVAEHGQTTARSRMDPTRAPATNTTRTSHTRAPKSNQRPISSKCKKRFTPLPALPASTESVRRIARLGQCDGPSRPNDRRHTKRQRTASTHRFSHIVAVTIIRSGRSTQSYQTKIVADQFAA